MKLIHPIVPHVFAMALVERMIENQDIFSLSIISIIFLILISSYEKDSGILFLACFLLTLYLSDLLLKFSSNKNQGFQGINAFPQLFLFLLSPRDIKTVTAKHVTFSPFMSTIFLFLLFSIIPSLMYSCIVILGECQ